MGRRQQRKRSMRHFIKGGVVRLASPEVEVNDEGPSANGLVPPENTLVPSELTDSREGERWFHLGRIMLTILVLGLSWILLLTWLVIQMPR